MVTRSVQAHPRDPPQLFPEWRGDNRSGLTIGVPSLRFGADGIPVRERFRQAARTPPAGASRPQLPPRIRLAVGRRPPGSGWHAWFPEYLRSHT